MYPLVSVRISNNKIRCSKLLIFITIKYNVQKYLITGIQAVMPVLIAGSYVSVNNYAVENFANTCKKECQYFRKFAKLCVDTSILSIQMQELTKYKPGPKIKIFY